MTDEEIFDLADQYGWMDDFGRWNFQPDRLVSFALAMSEKNVQISDKWVGLTDEEIYDYADKFLYQHGSNYGIKSFGKAIEAKLKEKNT